MNKSELIEKMADAADISKAAAARALDAMTDEIAIALKQGETVSLIGLEPFRSRNALRARDVIPRLGRPLTSRHQKRLHLRLAKR